MGGDDTLWGDGSSTGATVAAGHDTFVFEAIQALNGVDTIKDFGIAGHKTAGVTQAGTYVADTLDLRAVHFTLGEGSEGAQGGEAGEEARITAATIDNYVIVKGNDLYVDTDVLGAGQAQLWAHLRGVHAGDLLNVKVDDFVGQIQARAGLGFSVDAALAGTVIRGFLSAVTNGDLVKSGTGFLFDGQFLDNASMWAKLAYTDVVDLSPTDPTTSAMLAGATWTANGHQDIFAVDTSSWTLESMLTNHYRFVENIDLTSDGRVDYQDFLAFDAQDSEDLAQWWGAQHANIKNMLPEVTAYFDLGTFAAGDTVELVGSYLDSSASQTVVALSGG